METIIRSVISEELFLNTTIYLKRDYTLPSGSFKYREAALVREYCHVAGLDGVVAVTSGNTGDALKAVCRDLSLRIFTWGKDLTRSAATTAAYEIYDRMPRARTLWFAGGNHPLKTAAHRIMAHECLKHFADSSGEDLRPAYFQATGSGYGCAAAQDIFAQSLTFRVRPRKNLGVEWCPALADAPSTENPIFYVGSDEIRESFEHLNQSKLPEDPYIGLEASAAFAACKSWLLAGGHATGPIIVNLTGILKTEVPW